MCQFRTGWARLSSAWGNVVCFSGECLRERRAEGLEVGGRGDGITFLSTAGRLWWRTARCRCRRRRGRGLWGAWSIDLFLFPFRLLTLGM